jgi:Asp-tRNA(Asn)/Glu-tRNA(Gln) amidotransferase A subunit family amidase
MKPTRLGLLQTAGWSRATSDAKAALASVASTLQSEGVTIATREHDPRVEHLESVIEPALPLSLQIITWESRWPLNTYARDMDRNKLSSVIQARLQAAEGMSLDDYRAALAERDAIRRTFDALSSAYDGFLTLATPGTAPVGLHSTGDPVFGVVSSLLGAPAVSLPVLESEGLPLGLQLLGFNGSDQQLFRHAGWVGGLLQERVLASTNSARSV